MSNLRKIGNKLFDKKTELKHQSIELKIGDDLLKLDQKTESLDNALDNEISDAYAPILQIERIVDEIPDKITNFKAFSNALQQLEVKTYDALDKIRNIEQDLGSKVKLPDSVKRTLKQLEYYQRKEEQYRADITKFNSLAKKYK